MSFGGLVAQTLHDSLPNIAGQVASGLVRLAALKAGVQPEDNLSNALGMGANMIASTFVSNEINPGQSQSMSYQVVKALFGFGMGFAENSIIGRYDQKEAQINPAYAYDYSESQAEFQAVTMVASSVLTAGLLSAMERCKVANATNTSWGRAFGAQFKLGILGGAQIPSNATPTMITTNSGPHPKDLPSYSPSQILPFAQNFGGMALLGNFERTGSWGSVQNFVNYSDIQDQMTGFTAEAGVAGKPVEDDARKQ